MSEKIAVHCKSENLLRKVIAKYGSKYIEDYLDDFNDGCMYIDIEDGLTADLDWVRIHNFTIISAEDYLKEGENEVSEFKVGDRVECVDVGARTEGDSHAIKLTLGRVYTIAGFKGSEQIILKGLPDYWPLSNRFKLATDEEYLKKRKFKAAVHDHTCDALNYRMGISTVNIDGFLKTKEETMNKNIVAAFPKTDDAVLVEDQLGDEIKSGFINGLVIKQYSTQILAEAKRLKAEEDK